jgi:hypothetical protein
MPAEGIPSERPDDNPEWTAEEVATARPASEVLPQFIGEKATQKLLRQGRIPANGFSGP